MSDTSNPLVASRQDSTQWYSGIGIAEDVAGLHDSISSGSWIEGGLSVLGVGMDIAQTVIDPVGTLASYGVGFLIEHVKPLQEALNYVAGDPDAIAAYAKTWSNVSTFLTQAADKHKSSVAKDVPDWQGAAADAYKSHAATTTGLLTTASTAAASASSAIELAGGIVSFVRQTVRDIVAQAVGHLAAWAAEEAFTLGAATPLVAAQATTYVAKTCETIAKLFEKLAASFKKLTPLLKKLKGVWEDLTKALKRRGHTPHESTHTKPAGAHKPSEKPTSTHGTETHTSSHTDPHEPTDTHTTSHDGDSPQDRATKDHGANEEANKPGSEHNRTKEQTTGCGDPVDGATGEFLLPETDLDLPGILPLTLTRRHRSNYRFGRWFGPSWSATLDMRIVVEADTVTFIGEDGVLLPYPHPEPGIPVPPGKPGLAWPLTRTDTGGYRIHDPDREITYHFEPEPTLAGLDVHLGNYAISGISDRHSNWTQFHYTPDGTPTHITHSGGYHVRIDTEAGRVVGLSVIGQASTVKSDNGTQGPEMPGSGGSSDERRAAGEGRHEGSDGGGGSEDLRICEVRDHSDSRRIAAGTSVNDATHNTGPTDGSPDGEHSDVESGTGHASGDAEDDNSDTNTGSDSGATSAGHEMVSRIREFGYQAGKLVTVTNGVGAITTYTYDSEHRITSWTDSNNTSLRNTYDPVGRVIAQHGTGGIMNAEFDYFTYPDGSGHRTTVTDSLGAATVFEFNADLQLTGTITPDGGRTTTLYLPSRRPVRVTDPNGNTTTYHYTRDGDLARITRPDEHIVTIDYAARNRPTTVTDADGSARHQEWDAPGNLTAAVDEAGIRTEYRHHPNGAISAIIESTGATTTVAVDLAGNPIAVTDPYGAVTRMERDHLGRLITVTDALGGITRYEWSGEGKLLRRTDPDGHSEIWTWDGEGNLLTHTDRADGQTRYAYGTFDLLAARTDPDHTTTRYTWDTERRLTAVVNPLGQRWTYTYSPSGHLAAETDYAGATTQYTHDPGGRIAAVITPSGITRRHWYDALGNLTRIQADTGEYLHYTHDLLGRPLTATSGIGQDPTHTLDFIYTPTGQLVSQRVDDHPPMQYAYDPHGHRTARRSPTGSLTTWDHDPTGRITTLTTDGHHINFTHDLLGRPTGWSLDALTFQQSLSPVGHVTHRELTAHAAGPATPTPVEPHSVPARILRRDNYTWRPDGYLTHHTTTRPNTPPEHRAYTLDPAGRITTLTHTNTPTEHYQYDPLSNITSTLPPSTPAPAQPLRTDHAPDSTTPVADPTDLPEGRREYRNNLLIRNGRTRYTYDPAGRMIRKEVKRLSRHPDSWHYRYNAFDQLTDIQTPDHQWWHYTYDALGRRTTKQHLGPDGQVIERIDYIWDGTHLTEQVAGRSTTRWSYQPDTYTPISQTTDQDAIDRQFIAIVSALTGQPAELIEPVTGQIYATATMDLWGRTNWRGMSDTPIRFPGQLYDPESGLHYNHNRYYDPESGRFTSSDPLGLPVAPNPYSYPHNPLTWLDPLGLRRARTPGLDDDLNLSRDYSGRLDRFEAQGRVDFEIHVYHKGNEVGIFGSNGWFPKHGKSADVTVPKTVENRLKGIAVKEMRQQGRLKPVGREDISGDKWKRKRVAPDRQGTNTEKGCKG